MKAQKSIKQAGSLKVLFITAAFSALMAACSNPAPDNPVAPPVDTTSAQPADTASASTPDTLAAPDTTKK